MKGSLLYIKITKKVQQLLTLITWLMTYKYIVFPLKTRIFFTLYSQIYSYCPPIEASDDQTSGSYKYIADMVVLRVFRQSHHFILQDYSHSLWHSHSAHAMPTGMAGRHIRAVQLGLGVCTVLIKSTLSIIDTLSLPIPQLYKCHGLAINNYNLFYLWFCFWTEYSVSI